ncbi:uncharacterized protein ARMOST_03738 [Armillaria ostoyae]|uniref:Uncharacterized protein n=1 Tax=Armillaria ostoyae TaxID=47428 RepID=A0A284QVA9_ARMOS|nr:uncharacterized protein ARMOST_03738 [Armillaria ostoyae]
MPLTKQTRLSRSRPIVKSTICFLCASGLCPGQTSSTLFFLPPRRFYISFSIVALFCFLHALHSRLNRGSLRCITTY